MFANAQPSSYEWLVARARPGDRVLDLACGDGYLLELLRARGATDLAGLDLSDGELAAARERLGAGVRLERGRAQSQPFPDASFDLVTCHLAFMLMDDVADVVAEVRRVLRPGGQFAAIVQRASPPIDDAWGCMIRRIVRASLTGPRLGDPRTHTEEGLREILQPFGEVRLEPLSATVTGSADDVWNLFVNSYLFDQLPPADIPAFEQSVREDWQPLALRDGTLSSTLTLFGIVAAR